MNPELAVNLAVVAGVLSPIAAWSWWFGYSRRRSILLTCAVLFFAAPFIVYLVVALVRP